MTSGITYPFNPLQTNSALYTKYSSSQTYYYSNVIAQIVKQKRTTTNITYEDTQYLCDSQEYLKRFYQNQQFSGKMFTFKEYYFYHEDCPRLFAKHIEELYTKWHDRKRDLVYKKLKILYNQSFSSSKSDSREDENQSASGITHFLLEISDYNPFSKKYYLRVDAKKQEKQKEKQEKKNKTVKDLSSLNHDLSVMLNDMSQLSNISTLEQQQSPRFSSLYHSKKLKINYSSETSTNHNSQSNSNIQSTIKFNFKKNKISSREKQKIGEVQKKNESNYSRERRGSSQGQRDNATPSRLSPKFADNKLVQNGFRNSMNSVKSKSIIQLSSFNPNRKSQIILNFNGKKETLKLKSDKKPSSRQNKINVQYKALKAYDSQKKALLGVQSHKKMAQIPQIAFTQHQKTNFQQFGKKSSKILPINTPLKQIPRKGSLRQQLIPFNKNSQFSDSKLQRNEQPRFRSHKSQYFSLPKQGLLNTRVNSPVKASFKIKQEKLPKQKLQVQIGKKGHELKIQ